MTTSVLVADGTALRIHHESECRRTTPVQPWSAPLLYGLSLAVALPPAAWLPPAQPALPAIQRTQDPVLDLAELRMVLGRPIAEVGRGRTALGAIDRRLHGLGLTFDVLRAGAESGALITIGVTGSDRAMTGDGRATPADLWVLACAAIPPRGLARRCQPGTAIDSMVVRYGDVTSQVAWLAADHLATVSVTDLDGNEERSTELAHAVAHLLAPRLVTRACGR